MKIYSIESGEVVQDTEIQKRFFTNEEIKSIAKEIAKGILSEGKALEAYIKNEEMKEISLKVQSFIRKKVLEETEAYNTDCQNSFEFNVNGVQVKVVGEYIHVTFADHKTIQ
jgi:ribosomal protein S20